MHAYGYPWDGKAETPDKLREASIVCTKEELESLIRFLTDIHDEIGDLEQADGEHWHYRDWTEQWSGQQPDLIVFLKKND